MSENLAKVKMYADTDRVMVMGVLNITPDSFSDGGRFMGADKAIAHAEEMVQQGADIVDVGGYSSRPGADDIDVEIELERLRLVVPLLRNRLPSALLSIDTFRAKVAAEMLDYGADIINDITGGSDPDMLSTVARYQAGYIAMHMQGTPHTMQTAPHYEDVVDEVRAFLSERVIAAQAAGIKDVWVDPGFGFGKTLHHNYMLLAGLSEISDTGAPLMVGLSRKSMFSRPLKLTPMDVIPSVSAAHLFAVLAGAKILRVHDVCPARQAIQVAEMLKGGMVGLKGPRP